MGELWNHWFWVTLALGVLGSSYVGSESLSIDSAGQHLAQHGEEFPPGRGKGDWFQRERTRVREENEEREERVIEGGKETVSVSQSSSVSKVSVKMGGVSVSGRDTKELRGSRKLAAGYNQLEADVRQSFFQQLLDRLQDLADVRVEEEEEEEGEMNNEELAEWSQEGEEETHDHLNSLEEAPAGYQLIYRDDDVDDYGDYYGLPSYAYYTDEDYADMLEEEQLLRLEESWQAPESPAAAPMDLLPLPEEGRSSYARGRALTFGIADGQEEEKFVEMLEIVEEEAEEEELEEVSAAVSVGVRLPNVATTPTDEVEKEAEEEVGGRRGDTQEEEEEIAAEVLIDRSKVELLTFRNKIGIFIGVVMIVLTISVVLGMISVSIRRARRGKRMMKEDEVSQADTVSTVMETSSYNGLPDSVYSNYIRKSSLSCDELTELDNDSFLTSLETISVMDRFGWD